jgi:hypothetical protein
VHLVTRNADTPSEIDAAFASFAEQHIGALLVGTDVFFNGTQRDQLAALAARYRIPTSYSGPVDASGLMSYGASDSDADRLAGTYVGSLDHPLFYPLSRARGRGPRRAPSCGVAVARLGRAGKDGTPGRASLSRRPAHAAGPGRRGWGCDLDDAGASGPENGPKSLPNMTEHLR